MSIPITATASRFIPHDSPLSTPATLDSETLIEKTMLTLVEEARLLDDPTMEDSFFIADISIVYRQFRKWMQHLSFVKPFYAVKCNNDPQVLQLLAQLGCGFDCASFREIQKVLQLDVDPSRIVYANTVKNPSYLRFAAKSDVKRMTFDNADELYKIKQYHPHAELLLRIITDDSDAVCQLSCKFGAPLNTTTELLSLAKELDLNVVGIAFHIGSGGGAEDAYPKALKDAHNVFSTARELGIHMSVLDIGGGFEDSTFEASAAAIRKTLSELKFGDIELIAEPGRFMVADAFTLVTAVIGRRMTGKDQAMIYITDGCYANLNCIIFDHQNPRPHLLDPSPGASSPMTASVWGPTCDGIDVVEKSVTFARAVDIGDWIYFKGVGAYTLAASTSFNGFNENTKVHYVCSELAY